ncbi:uncharacterized protein LOC114934050 [Nylanderia fulva]|uniref:uncharacterized protein LOC114928045 n=1 Tax=Nylanderia fulva TaxID=613905 RepID=UPI0010FB9D19|nr:uncharacterized protein LOC114928045 [Nylanderia fulva]XP_029162490.1 uncharacterized protein LOC114934050 [Nylanderia fulva]
MWVRLKSKRHDKVYYFNEQTRESRWDKPKKTGYHIYHILIKHEKSRKPEDIPVDEALERCNEVLSILERNKEHMDEDEFLASFKRLAAKHSMCSSKKRGGDLGHIVKNEMVKEFEKVVFELRIGEFKGPISTTCGYHIIYRR